MPPHVHSKRLREPSPEKRSPAKPKRNGKGLSAPPRKPTLFDDVDASSTPPRSSTRNGSTSQIIDDSEDDTSSLSSLSDVDFDDVPPSKRQKLADPEDEEDEDEDIEFEDVDMEAPQSAVPRATTSGTLELTLTRDTRISLANVLGKKGPSKTERRIRNAAHCVHVQLLMWHNAIRNAWICDPEVQGTLISLLPPRIWDEIERWSRNSGLEVVEESPKKVSKGKGKGRPSRDWGDAAKRLEKGAVDMSHGDPLFRLMKVLAAWWKQRFRVTAPGLRKIGYMQLERLDRLTKAWNQEEHNPDKFGERIRNIDEFRNRAQECTGSRDVGAQLFTALLRGLGLEARLIANLQPLGFGWTKQEEAEPEKAEGTIDETSKEVPSTTVSGRKPTNRVGNGGKGRAARTTSSSRAVEAEESDSELLPDADSDNDLVIELQKPLPKRGKVYDTDLEFPHYWTEVLSPVTKKYLAVDAIVKSVIATNRELVESLEPRGAKADKAKQVIAYVVGFSADGTAKDVTVRYLKRQVFPGRTKGVRMPVEKIPVHDHNGKVKRYELRDWFRSVMRGYVRGDKDHPITEIDEEEDAADLKPAKAEKKEVKEGEETLQYYKQSKEFVLERHLKREEALLPTAEPVKFFRNKSKGSVAPQDEPVYSRKDVVQVKSAETWHKQGRAPIAGEEPLKRVPYRAATTNRRRELAEAEAATGQKVLQGLYSFDQTDWIIPPPIQNGIIPKNEYGNIDLFAQHMCPEGAVHVPYRGAMRVCKRLGIDFAEAVVDFEFGHRMAVPVIQGVVVAEEYHNQVMEELAKDEAEKARKEDEKRRKAALAKWRKFLMGMRIVERIKQDYGHLSDDVDIFGRGRGDRNVIDGASGTHAGDETMAGGFLRDGSEEEEESVTPLTSGFFPVADDDDDEAGDVLEVDHGDGAAAGGFLRGRAVAADSLLETTFQDCGAYCATAYAAGWKEAVLKCFPNICPEYLLQVATRLEFDSETIITHILDEQERGVHYPVQPNPVKRKRKREETPEEPNEPDKNDARLLNKNDPFTVQYRQAARHLIMAAFPTVYAPDVDRIFKENNYLLSGTYKAIEELLTGEGGPKLRVKKVVSKLDDHIYDDSHKDGEKLALAEYRTALSQTEAKKAEERNLERARAAGEIEECGCCFGEYALNRMIHCSGEVLHWFCRDCSRKMAEVAVGEGKHQLQCMSMDECEAEFAPDQRAIFLDKKLARALEELERDASLRMAGIENLARCPFCPYAAEYPPADQNKEFECQNPDCGVVSCRLCEKETHIPKTCKEAADDGYSARHQIEEAMSLALIRKCNKCGAPFIKESGCNKMTCTSPGCHNVQCYICSQSCGYDHFNDRKRGGKEGNCPLFDPDVEQRHEEEVRAAQEKARQEIASANPGVDPKMLDVEFSERIKADDEERKKARELARAQAQAPAPRM
ncbi:Rad4 transglutaminase-like domain-containing protein [Echria macrotheca]|uniref:Rad4 transglutaminase-like domain-containing protein n=1 Tax=Echria macrotheca TaxID=438768 RepID=A0AAJ0FBP4_9PEZI|nr:Rad4 transglutaminase-like domain-containing protein [Echria macrotheca]